MLKKRLIPKLQLALRKSFRGPQPVLVVTRQFDSRIAIGDPLSQAKIYEAQLVDELVLLDLERTEDSWLVLLDTVERMSQELATPLSVGGGLQNIDQVQALLDRGADKVVLNTVALSSPELISHVASAYGQQCVVISIDVKKTMELDWQVYLDCGRISSPYSVTDWARKAVDFGAGEIMVTSISRDGTGAGLELDLISELSSVITAPLIAAGGCGLAQHFVEGYQAGASAVSAGSFFAQRDQNPMQCRSHIRNAGIPIRLEV